ncbi:hypothetical protein ALQ48_200068 [Pseudomonas coronafaciens pv. zizaniae]|nr:hypothetical protein ALQ48_200068 [Pseudomonas coronafaciens pv. zizaniae]
MYFWNGRIAASVLPMIFTMTSCLTAESGQLLVRVWPDDAAGLCWTLFLVYYVLLRTRIASVSNAIEFIETSMFTRQIKALATDDELRSLQAILIESPDKGDLITNTGGLRKVRMAMGNQGKSGSARVIYFLATPEVIYLVMAYPKSTKDSLTDAEKTELKLLTQKLKKEV